MSHRDGRVTLSAWVDPVVRDHARTAAKSAGVEFSRWVERSVQRAIAEESAARAIRDAEARQKAVDEMVDLLQDRVAALEAERDVLNGAWCAENQAEGRGPCGACVTCLRQGTPRAVQEAVDAATGPLRKRIAALEAERAEVAKELRELSEPTGVRTHDALMTLREEVRALAYRLERKGEP